jgi:hypothetical protein
MADSVAKRRWIKENTTLLTVKFNNRTDADIVAHITSVDNKTGYIKQLIRQDIEKQKTN